MQRIGLGRKLALTSCAHAEFPVTARLDKPIAPGKRADLDEAGGGEGGCGWNSNPRSISHLDWGLAELRRKIAHTSQMRDRQASRPLRKTIWHLLNSRAMDFKVAQMRELTGGYAARFKPVPENAHRKHPLDQRDSNVRTYGGAKSEWIRANER